MIAPGWIADAVRDFGRAAGLGDFALNDRGVAAMRFENGVTVRFEYVEGEMAIAATMPVPEDTETAKRILAFAHPSSGFGIKVRSGLMAKSGSALFAVRMAASDVTQPAISAAFSVLWRIANEIGGAA